MNIALKGLSAAKGVAMPNPLLARLRLLLANSLTVALCTLGNPAHALQQVFNVDMTGLTPQPTYDQIVLSYSLVGNTNIGCSLWGKPNKDISSFVGGCAGQTILETYTHPDLLDGIFSISFSFDHSAAHLATPFQIIGITDGNRTAPLVILDVNQVPEPGALALLAAALMGLGFAFRTRGRPHCT